MHTALQLVVVAYSRLSAQHLAGRACQALPGRSIRRTHVAAVQDFQEHVLALAHVTTTLEHATLAPLSDYLLELALVEYAMLRFPPHMVAGASVLLARVLIAHLREPDTPATPRARRHGCRAVVAWTRAMHAAVRLEAADMAECAAELLRLLHRAREVACAHAAHVAQGAPPGEQLQLERALAACGVSDSEAAANDDECGTEDLCDEEAAVLRVVQRFCCAERQFVACQPLLDSLPDVMFVPDQAFLVATQAFGPLPVERQVTAPPPWLE